MVVLLVAGIVLSCSILTYLIDRKETSTLLSYDRDRSALLANDITREVRELMLVEKKPAVIRNLVTNHVIPGEVQVALFKGDGTLYAGETSYRVPAGMFSAPRETTMRDGEQLIFFTPLLNEKACQQCHAADKNMLGVLMVDMSMKKMVSVTRDLLKNMIYFTIVIAALSSGLLIVILRRMIFLPLTALHTGAEKISSGDYQHRVLLPDNNDEFGRLAATFNQMAESIETSHLTLERAVQQRTTELEVVANLSVEVFRGDRPLAPSIDIFLEAIIDKLGFGYASVCLVDRETGLLSQVFKKGSDGSLCPAGISLANDQPLSRLILEAKPVLVNAVKMGFAEDYPHLMVIPIISHQRKKCREVNLCYSQSCPAFDNIDERCWLIDGTLCRSRQSIQGKEKLFGCIHCPVFPVYGVLLAGTDHMHMLTDSTLHSLEILAAEIASALENYRLMDEKKEDILRLIKLHDLSVQKMTTLDMPSLMQFIVSSVTPFVSMHAAILWLKKGEELHFSSFYGAELLMEGDNGSLHCERMIPPSILIDKSPIGVSVTERRTVESARLETMGELSNFIEKCGFKYIVSVPLIFQDDFQGCMTLFRRSDYYMTDSEKAILALFANQASAAIRTIGLYQDLRSSEEKYRRLMNEAGDGIVLLDTAGNFIELNTKAVDILGYPISSLLGKPFSSLIHEEQLQHASDAFRETATNGIGSAADLLIVRGDGSQAFIDISVSVINTSSRQVIQAIFRDVSERKKMDMALQTLNEKVYGTSSKLFFQSMALNMAKSLGMAFVEIGELTADRRHVRTIAVCADGNIIDNFEYALAGTPCDNVVGKAFCSHPEHVQALFPDDKMLADMGAESYMGLPLFDSKGNPIGIVAALDRLPISDMQLSKLIFQMYSVRASSELERMQSDQLLKAEKDFSEAIFDAAASGIIVVDSEGLVLKINSSGAKILKTHVSDVIGQKISALYPEASVFLAPGQALGNEVTITLTDNSSLPIGFVNSLLPCGYYQNECLIVMFRDLSEIKKLQAELRKKEYFETMGKVVSGVAHEVRNPLFGISSIGQILERESENPQHLALITAMLRECDRVKNLIEELLLYTRPARLDIKEMDLGILVLELEHHIKGKRDAITISVEIPPSVTISADRDKITQVLLNIINNALEAAKTCVTITANQAEDITEIRVGDDGPGIPQKNLERIFEPFFTTKKGGTGLGLPICKKLMEDHEGSLEIISQENRGTEVVLRLRS